ncbi:RHS repeat-associated core domain-containing protein [Pseudomonas sp. GM78]|uniref:RHS repeat-associated core domain-containing protein n=1 Tax=Pseudomonas sp. GM78 TaxID=1144337 RepID=UPI003FD08432
MAYSPYGHRSAESGLLSLLGFNGERPDPVTGHYLLGNGYRAFNPVLMRFNSPDSSSPFGEGGPNTYMYCSGDPVNFADPTGHVRLAPSLNLFEIRPRSTGIAIQEFVDNAIDNNLTRGTLNTRNRVKRNATKNVQLNSQNPATKEMASSSTGRVAGDSLKRPNIRSAADQRLYDTLNERVASSQRARNVVPTLRTNLENPRTTIYSRNHMQNRASPLEQAVNELEMLYMIMDALNERFTQFQSLVNSIRSRPN